MLTWLKATRNYSNPDSINYQAVYLREQMSKNLGYMSYADQAQAATLGNTLIVGGYLNTEIIEAQSIRAEHLSVDDLSAISGKFSKLMAGATGGARLEMGESVGVPFLNTYDSGNKKRVSLGQDKMQFFDEAARNGGNIYSYVYEPGSLNLPSMAIHSPRYLMMIASPNYLPGWEEGYLANDHALISLENISQSGYPKVRLMAWKGSTLTSSSVVISPEDIRLDGQQIRMYSGGQLTLRLYGDQTMRWNPQSDGGYSIYFDKSGVYQGNARPTIRPSTDTFGFLGTSSHRFYQGFASGGWLTSSERRLKTNIQAANKHTCYDQVKALKFKTYNFTSEAERAKTEEPGFKVTDYIGVIAEESPDIICDAEKKNINLYPYISLIGAAVQEMQDRLESIENVLIKDKR